METVFVSEISYAKARSCFERISAESHFQFTPIAEDEESLAAAISKQGVRAFIADILPYTGELYDALPSGGVIARFGVLGRDVLHHAHSWRKRRGIHKIIVRRRQRCRRSKNGAVRRQHNRAMFRSSNVVHGKGRARCRFPDVHL